MKKEQIYGLIGYPVKHSFSPAMHNAAFKSLNISAEYRLFNVAPDEFDSFFKGIDPEHIRGFNITVPYKEAILNHITLEQESSYLKQVKAVNTVIREGGAWKGFNTDIPGFQKHITEYIALAGKQCAVIGAGGASRAVTYVFAKNKAKKIVLFDIDQDKSERVAAMIIGLFPGFPIEVATTVNALNLRGADVLVNATPLGLRPSDPSPVPENMLHSGLFVYDLIYNPPETSLIKAAKKAGAQTANGLGMLLYQGVLAFTHFTGTSEQTPRIINIMRGALKEELKR